MKRTKKILVILQIEIKKKKTMIKTTTTATLKTVSTTPQHCCSYVASTTGGKCWQPYWSVGWMQTLSTGVYVILVLFIVSRYNIIH